MSGCCGHDRSEPSDEESDGGHACGGGANKIDWLLWGSLVAVVCGMIGHFVGAGPKGWLIYAHGTYEFMTKAWWGIVVGMVAVAVIGQFPQSLVASMLGRGGTFGGILRATAAGVFLDLCNHGILMIGLLLTLVATTVIEVCSEGSSPIAADLLTRAAAPGNAFTFLMAGAATDYTELMALRETTKSWRLSLMLPLITVPQVILVGYLLNLTVG